MKQLSNPASSAAPQVDLANDAFDRLAAITAALAVSFFLFGYALIYWRNADMDFMVIYNALALNDGKPQLFFDHTAYITILAVRLWYQLLHALGLLDAWSLSAIPPAGCMFSASSGLSSPSSGSRSSSMRHSLRVSQPWSSRSGRGSSR